MPIAEAHHIWTLTSTGAGTAKEGLRTCGFLTLLLQANESTASVGIEVGRSSTSPFVRMGSTSYDLGWGESQVVQMDGPVPAIRPYLIGPLASTSASVVVELFGV